MANIEPEESPAIIIEDVETALREGIERAKEMVHDYERLFRRAPPGAAGAEPVEPAVETLPAEPPLQN